MIFKVHSALKLDNVLLEELESLKKKSARHCKDFTL